MTDDPLAGVEPRYHSAMPDWVMLRGLVIRSIPVCVADLMSGTDGEFGVFWDSAEGFVRFALPALFGDG
jgi:hypothetical protein